MLTHVSDAPAKFKNNSSISSCAACGKSGIHTLQISCSTRNCRDHHFYSRKNTNPLVIPQPPFQSTSNVGIECYYMSLTRLSNSRIIVQYLPVPHVVDSAASQKFH